MPPLPLIHASAPDSLHAKLWGVKHDLNLAWNLNCGKVIVEVDSQVVNDTLKTQRYHGLVDIKFSA